MVSSTKSSCRPVTAGVLQGLILGPVLFSVINDLEDGVECTLSKIADGTNLGGVVDAPEGCAAIQRNFNGLEESQPQ